MNAGWIFEVESENGTILFVARTSSPLKAEEIIRETFNIPQKIDVIPVRPLSEEFLDELKMAHDEAKGPM